MLSIVTSVAEAGRADVGDPKDRRGTPSDGDGVFFFFFHLELKPLSFGFGCPRIWVGPFRE